MWVRCGFSEAWQNDTGPKALSKRSLVLAVNHGFQGLTLATRSLVSKPCLKPLTSTAQVEIDEFLMGCLRLRGNARAVDAVVHELGKLSSFLFEFMLLNARNIGEHNSSSWGKTVGQVQDQGSSGMHDATGCSRQAPELYISNAWVSAVQ